LRTRRHRFIAPLLLIAFWSAQLGMAMHAPETAHRVCEHGELVDDPGQAQVSGAASRGPAETQIAPVSERGTTHAGHEHCAFGTLLQQTGTVASLAPRVSVAPAQPVHLVAVAPRAPDLATLPLYRLAPKTSPPA
jgi:hypothetical protein